VEIANVLFIHSQIDQETRRLIPLATPFAETVIGVERLALLLQEKSSVFEIDCLAPLADWVRSCCQTPGPSGWVKSEHVIADHIRALLFLTADGAPAPGKGGQARVMRKLVRGVLTHKRVLGIIEASFIPDLIEVALDLNQEQHPYLHRGRGRLLTYFEQERRRFDNTLSAGYRHLDRIIQGEGSGSLSGEQALDLVKGHGLPFALLQAALARRGIRLNLQEYWEAHARWRRLVAGA
jgi:alanyl-tRNA synthetase